MFFNWPLRTRLALECQPNALLTALIVAKANHEPVPEEVQALVAELSRRRRGRPRQDDRLRAAARAWQQNAAQSAYSAALYAHQVAKAVGAQGGSFALRDGTFYASGGDLLTEADAHQLGEALGLPTFVADWQARRPVLVQGEQPHEAALADAARVLGTTPEALEQALARARRRSK
jgi:hypothetical protein